MRLRTLLTAATSAAAGAGAMYLLDPEHGPARRREARRTALRRARRGAITASKRAARAAVTYAASARAGYDEATRPG